MAKPKAPHRTAPPLSVGKCRRCKKPLPFDEVTPLRGVNIIAYPKGNAQSATAMLCDCCMTDFRRFLATPPPR